jgi:transcriptional regulator with XRE-family HTH domain
MTDNPDPIDRQVGANLRALRIERGLSQTDLGRAVGVTFQQIQKYENSGNRISASRMYHIAVFLKISPMALFRGVETPGDAPAHDDRRTVRAIASLRRISDPRVRASTAALINELAKLDQHQTAAAAR